MIDYKNFSQFPGCLKLSPSDGSHAHLLDRLSVSDPDAGRLFGKRPSAQASKRLSAYNKFSLIGYHQSWALTLKMQLAHPAACLHDYLRTEKI